MTYEFVDKPRYEFVDQPSVAPGPPPSIMDTWKSLLKDVVSTKRGPLGIPIAATAGAPIAGGPMAMAQGLGQEKLGEIQSNAAYRAGGAVTDLAAPYVSPEVAGALGYGTNVGLQAGASYLTGEGAKFLTAPPAKEAGRFLMHSALKPSVKAMETGKGAKAIETLLQEGYNPTAGGVEKMQSVVNKLNDDVASAIKSSDATVDKRVVANYLKDAMAKFEGRTSGVQDVKVIENAWTDFLKHPWISESNAIPVQVAQKMKMANYQSLGDKAYGELKTAATEAEKQLTRGLRTEIGKVVPEILPTLERESALINAMKLSAHRAAVDANKNPFGLGLLNPVTLLWWLWDRSPSGKAAVGRALYSGALPSATAQLAAMPALMRSGQPPQEAALYEFNKE